MRFAIFMLIVGIFDLGNSSDACLVLRAQEGTRPLGTVPFWRGGGIDRCTIDGVCDAGRVCRYVGLNEDWENERRMPNDN
jgi:hypothetical protein